MPTVECFCLCLDLYVPVTWNGIKLFFCASLGVYKYFFIVLYFRTSLDIMSYIFPVHCDALFVLSLSNFHCTQLFCQLLAVFKTSVSCLKCPPCILSSCSSTSPSLQRKSSSMWTAKRWQRSQSRRPTTSRWRATKCLARWSNQEVERGSPLQ